MYTNSKIAKNIKCGRNLDDVQNLKDHFSSTYASNKGNWKMACFYGE